MKTKLCALLSCFLGLFLVLPAAAQSPRPKPFADETWLPGRVAAAVAKVGVHRAGVATPSGCFLAADPVSLPAGGGPVQLTMVCTSGDPPTAYAWQGEGVTGKTTAVVLTSIISTASFSATASNSAGSETAMTTVPVLVAIQLSPSTLPNGMVGTPYSQSFSASGGTPPYSFSRTSGALPPGLQLAGNVLSGTPTRPGDYPFRIAVTDSSGNSGFLDYTLRIADSPILLSPSTLPAGTANAPYSATVTATGGTGGYVFTLAGTLPPGVTFSAQGVFSGTPVAASSSTVTVTATDNAGNRGSREYVLAISAAPVSITLAPTTLPSGTVGTAYPATQVTASGGTAPYVFSVQGSLPPGLSLSASGLVSGTPTTANPSASFTIVATDSTSATGSRAYTIVIGAAPIVVSPASLPPATVGVPYAQSFSATGGSGTFAFSASGTLPPGLALSGNVLSGTPTVQGTSSFTIIATDATGATGNRAYALTVSPSPAAQIEPVSPRQQTATAGQPLPSPLIVRVADSNGKPVVGAQLTATSTAAGDVLAGPTPVAGQPGQYAYNVTLGPSTGARTISICVVGTAQCTAFVIGTTQQLTDSAKQLTGPQAMAAIAAPTQQLGNIQQHLDNRRLMRTPSVLQGLQVNVGGQALPVSAFALAPAADGKPPAGGGAAADDPFARWGLFVQGVIDVGKADATNAQPAFDIDTKGLTLGADYRLDKGVLGAALGLTKSTSDLSNDGGDQDARGWSVSLFGSYAPNENAYIDLILNFGRNKFDTTRKAPAPGSGATAEYNSSPRGDQFGASLSAGYQFYRQALTLSPYARVEYVTADIDSFTESGGEGALEVSGQRYSNTVLTLGGLAQYSWSQSWGVLVPYGRLELQYVAQSSSDAVTAQYAPIGLANSPVGIPVVDVDKTFGTIAVGATAVLPRGVSGYFNYQYLFGNDDFRSSRYTLGLRVQF
ncbi:MAG: autotransporter domain-containing protein [Burkholderiales bacterium]|nr:autotransporter domain-containing protein [Burkholderiales bacterium]